MTYAESITYLYDRLPVFHRIGPKAIKPGLGNIIRLCDALGNPQHRFRSIHVAGTNGKGSTAHLLASVYQSAGYRVGLYTSPHLKSFTERVRINGQPIPEAAVAAFVGANRQLIEAVEPSFFEVTVALAFAYFGGQEFDLPPVDLAIIEVGLGGRLDSTNIIIPELSVITNIGWDHTDILGETLEKIAAEKAGIIKAGIPVVVGETLPETRPVFVSIAAQQSAPIHWAETSFSVVDAGLKADGQRWAMVSSLPDHTTTDTEAGSEPAQQVWPGSFPIGCDLPGLYQLANLRTLLTAVAVLQSRYPVSLAALQGGISLVVAQTGLKGRWQQLVLPDKSAPQQRPDNQPVTVNQPLVVADTAHNQPGLLALMETVRRVPHRQLHLILGLVADKDRSRVLSVLPTTARYYFCQAQTPRSLPAGDLQREAATYNLIGDAFTDVNQALDAALLVAEPTDFVLVTGSNYIIAEIVDL